MDAKKRKFLGTGAALLGAGALAAASAGAGKNVLDGIMRGTAGIPVRDPVNKNALEPEYSVDAQGQVSPGQGVRTAFNLCWGCTTLCGVRLHIDAGKEQVTRVAGNPYNPLASSHALPMQTPVSEALRALSARADAPESPLAGHSGRAAVCGRGAAMTDAQTNPFRVRQCLKRVGKRGEGRWKSISFEQLVEEVVEGGGLFGEGPVDGLRAIRETPGPANPEHPEFGPHANRLLLTYAFDDGREVFFFQRFGIQSYGTRNFGKHGAYCGLSFRMGSGMALNNLATNTHAKPDFEHCEFALFWGTAPAQAGNPFNRSARMVAEARTLGNLHYVVIDPVLRLSVTDAARDRARWVPVRPGTDAALALGMIRWILENARHDAAFLSHPTLEAATSAGEAAFSNATHLVCLSGPQQNKILRLPPTGQKGPDGTPLPGEPLVMSLQGELTPAGQCPTAALFFRGEVTLPDGTTATAATALQLLKEEACAHSLDEYAALCGVPRATIEDLAREFTAHGKRAVVDVHGGMMSLSGMNATFAALTLNTLIGNLNVKGGVAVPPPNFHKAAYAGPRYDLNNFPGKKGPQGFPANRCRAPYEKSTAFRKRKAAGLNPYPADSPWFPLTPPNMPGEHLLGHANGYPFTFKAWINWTGNVLYGHGGLHKVMDPLLREPKNLPLIIGIDAFHNETNAYADYLVPDPCMYEGWGGFAGAWCGVLTRMSTARWPAVAPSQQKTAEGQPVCMEQFLIAVARRMDLPGFGDKAIPGADGALHPLNTPQDYYLRLAANMAFGKGQVQAAPSAEDTRLSGIGRILPDITAVLPPEERGPVARIYSRGGLFAPFAAGYDGDKLGSRWTRALCVYNEDAAKAVHWQTGRHYSGLPTLRTGEFCDGTPLRQHWSERDYPLLMISFKSNLINSYAIVSPRLRTIKPVNMVLLHPHDARALGVLQGERVRLVSPGGATEAQVTVTETVMPGVVAVEHGFGHKALGAADVWVDGRRIPAVPGCGTGMNLNDLVPGDPSRKGVTALTESDSGSAVRQGIPVRVERLRG